MTKTRILPTRVSQPLAGKQITDASGNPIKSPSVCRDGNANPSYHPWEIHSLDGFKIGKQIQCGRKSSYHCNLKTVRWVRGYRNTCPIAGCCGTFNRPAPLILDQFNFKAKKITEEIKIQKLEVRYSHFSTGVDVSVGQGSEYKNWTGEFPYVDIILYKNDTKIQTIRHDSKVPLAKNGTVRAVFNKDIIFNPLKDNLKIEINYAANGGGKYKTVATNPAIIYATGLNIEIDYNYTKKPEIPKVETVKTGISGVQSANTIITDPRNAGKAAGTQNCRTYLTHTIHLINATSKNLKITAPNGVKYEKISETRNKENTTIVYRYQDTSGIAGQKTIMYTLKTNETNKILKKTYVAKLYTKPTISIEKKYIKNQTYANEKFISVEGSCWNKIKIYVDGNKKELITWTNNNISQQNFLNKINQLTCGNHTLYVYIDDVLYKKFEIQITAPNIIFESDLQGEYTQSSEDKAIVIITRTDSSDLNQPIALTIISTANTEESETVKLNPKESYTKEIDLSNPGTYELTYRYNNGCTMQEKSFGRFVIRPKHIQLLDKLIIQSEDTPIEYESIVVRKGDNQRKPVTYTSATLINGINDFILFGGDGLSNIGELGYGTLAIRNIQQDTIHNLCIELNPLYKSEDEYDEFDSLVMEWKTGMLQNFEDNFYILNPELKSLVNIFNIQNQDLINEGTENVVLQISEIRPNEFINIKIPYSASYEREIYMNFLFLGEPSDFIYIDELAVEPERLDVNDDVNRDKYISQSSTINTRQCMCISLKTDDLRASELYIESGNPDRDDLDRNDISIVDDLDILYKVKIPESECDEGDGGDIPIKTKISNDMRLIPTGYKIEGNHVDFDIYDEEGKVKSEIVYQDDVVQVHRGTTKIDKKIINADVFLRYRDENNQNKYIRAQTDEDGVATLKYTIPEYQDTSTNLDNDVKTEYRLEDILNSVDIFYQGNEFYKPSQLSNVIKNPLKNTKIQKLGILYYTTDNKAHYVANGNRGVVGNISTIYLIGQLTDADGNGINQKIITLINEKYEISQQGISGIKLNTPSQFIGKDGLFRIRLHYDESRVNLLDMYTNTYVGYDGDLFFEKSSVGNITRSQEKYDTYLYNVKDYNIYHIGETVDIKIKLLSEDEKEPINTINIDFSKQQNPSSKCTKSIHIFYKACQAKNTEAFKTIYKTNSDKLLPNQIEKNIYCGVDTDLKIIAQLEQKVVENHNVNILMISAINGYKPNQDVIIKGIIGPDATKQRLGDYLALTAIDIDKEKYSYDQTSDVVYWKIGNMGSYETQKCNILLEAEEVGHNTIYVCGFDYMTPDTQKVIATTLSLDVDENEKETYHVDDVVPIKAVLQTEDARDVYGQIKFMKSFYNEETGEYSTPISESIANISTYNGQHFAKSYTRLNKPAKTKLYAKYDGTKILSLEYKDSVSNEIIFDNIQKYDTQIFLNFNQDTFYTNENINVEARVAYLNEEQTDYQTYFDKNLDIRIFIENQELTNISYNQNTYNVSFMITKAGKYTIKAFIPNTDKTTEALATATINVIDGEDDE